MKPFEGCETLIDFPEADFHSPQAVVKAVDSGAEIVNAVVKAVKPGVEAVNPGAEVVDAVTQAVDSGADHRRDEYAEREGARDDGPDDRLGVPAHEDYCSTRGGRAWGAAGKRALAARMLGAASAVWLGAAGAQPASAETLDRILAVAAGHVIMQSDVRAFVDLQLTAAATDAEDRNARDEQVLTYLIERRLVLDEVDRYVVADPPAADVERRLAAVAARFRSGEELAAVLARVGYTTDDLRQVLQDDARRDAYVASRFGPGGAPAGDGQRAAMVAEWVAGLVARGPVVRIRRPPGP